jgi:putative component of toxin-antitoxin plasmid stabilization module
MEEIANQSEPVVNEPTIETQAPEVVPATTQEAPKGMTVKYNKEDRFVSDEELPSYVQKGLNYDKVSERAKEADTYQQNLERIAKHYGFETHSEYLTELDEFDQQQKIAEEAEKLGVDESVIREHLEPLKKQVAQFEQEKESLRQERLQVQINAELTDLKTKYPDFEKHQEKVFDMAINQGYKLEDAYKVATYEEKLSGIAKQTEAETIKKIQQNAVAGTGALGSEGTEHKTGFAAMSKDEQRRMIEEVKQGKRTSFD